MDVHFTCIVCNHPYNPEGKRPLVLPCSHSFCSDCLQKLEDGGDKLCPVCRTSWSSVLLSDLPSCYQLIPSDKISTRNGNEVIAVEKHSEQTVCGDHIIALDFWCESCDFPLCKKCWRVNHKCCDILLMEEKWEKIKVNYDKSYSSLKKIKDTRLAKYLSDNEKQLLLVNKLVTKFQELQTDLEKHREALTVWEMEANSLLQDQACSVTSAQNMKEIQLKISTLNKLEVQLPTGVTSLLLDIAETFECSSDDTETFITGLKYRMMTAFIDEFGSEAIDHPEVPPTAHLVKEAANNLKDGEVWIISNDATATAVCNALYSKDIRPSRVDVTYTGMPEKRLMDLKAFFENKKDCAVLVREELKSFLDFNESATATRSSTTRSLNAILKGDWCCLTKFWGHLDESALLKMPHTLQSLGLALREEKDVAVLKAFSGVIFKLSECRSDKERLIMPNLTEINLAMDKTFITAPHPTVHWSWTKIQMHGGGIETIYLKDLARLGIRVRVHVPGLRPGDISWLRGNLNRMMFDQKCPLPLYLPGALVDPIHLLSPLYGSFPLDVHLPRRMPMLVPKEDVVKQYKEAKSSISWDLE